MFNITSSLFLRKTFLLLSITSLFSCVVNSAPSVSFVKDELKIAHIPELPKKLTFADEEVPIHLPYVQEAVMREMITTMCMHTRTLQTIILSSRYIPVIKPILKKHGIPEDFVYLCMAESGFDVNAYSSARAAGLWQFIPNASHTYNVEIGSNVDLRYNIEIATEAACEYLLDAYDKFGNWTLAAASYNAGMHGVKRRKTTQMVKTYWDLFLPEEAMRYVPRILSFKILFEDPAKFGFIVERDDYLRAYKNYDTVHINKRNIEWSQFAKSYNTDYRQLRILNPWIRSYSYINRTNKNYVVKIPNEKFKKLGY